MGKSFDLTGQKFGMLTVIKKVASKGHSSVWECRCECGKIKHLKSGHLRNGSTKSCGCNKFKHLTRHGKSHTRIYKIWDGIIERCALNRSTQYELYKGRGITVCDEWKNDFVNFYNWAMANGYSDDLTIDRINSNGNYEPSNCRWATTIEQANNRRNNRYVTYNKEQITLAELARKLNVSYKALWWYANANGLGAAIKHYKKALNTP